MSDEYTIPAQPTTDDLNHSYVRIVHENGLHYLAMVGCHCRGPDRLYLDLMASRLVTTSFHTIRTLFTGDVLDHYRLCNLELKALAYQFYQLLVRISAPFVSVKGLALYNEFRRMTRLWRWTSKLIRAGFGHEERDPMNPNPGELANYCPACPQQGKNLAEDWRTDPNRFVYQRVFVADGNFKADHVKQGQGKEGKDDDVWLSEGGGMDPQRQHYKDFLKVAMERCTVSPKHLESINIIQYQHGCYAPNALVDLFKGEQQKNVDYAFLQALKTTGIDPDQGVMLIYDIACQYYVHLKEQLGEQLPPNLKIDRAIGLFHVHAHKDDCFFHFNTSFIPGSAVVSGEILESLWSTLNSISPSVRTATLAHRAEVLDDHACDSNHKKALGMTSYLCTRLADALKNHDDSLQYFHELTNEAGPAAVSLWTNAIVVAEKNRLVDPKAMNIYCTQKVGKPDGVVKSAPIAGASLEHWLTYALKVEEKQ
ncbi:hypothetical protein BDN70DRAFT_821224 [Pholiota conissans]|uniref:CxC2-like cysteine cluster KDZ transposase-associated domain-containing protein n=1 Tax=Pholiota conissans TaxID=109636 RepID=A0A9P5YIK4_9AGAR|nr:hypothetical protein BDN70DRAFT_821224 [Pholiota conissans]